MEDVLWDYYKSNRFIDCEVSVDINGAERRWGLHKVVLAANSSYFDSHFTLMSEQAGDLSQVLVKLPFPSQVTRVFDDIVPYLYNRNIQSDIPLEDTVPLLVLAALLGMDSLSTKLFHALRQLSSAPSECVAVLSLLTDQWLKDLDSVVCKAALGAAINHHAMAIAVKGAREAAANCQALHKHCIGILVPSLADLRLEDLPPESLLSILQHPSSQDAKTTSSLISKYLIKKEPASLSDNLFSQLCLHVTNIPPVDLTAMLKLAIERKENSLIKKCLTAASDACDKVEGIDPDLLDVLASGAGIGRKRKREDSDRESKNSSETPHPGQVPKGSPDSRSDSQRSSAPLILSPQEQEKVIPLLTGGSDVLFGTLQERGGALEEEEHEETEALDAALTMSQSQDGAGMSMVLERLHRAMASHRKKRKVMCTNAILETRVQVHAKAEQVRSYCSEMWSSVEDTFASLCDELNTMSAEVRADAEAKVKVIEELRAKCDTLEDEVYATQQRCTEIDNLLAKVKTHTTDRIEAAGDCSKQVVTFLKTDIENSIDALETKLNNVADKNTGALKRLSALLATELSMDS
eukprot:TRINITY_DN16477_c0_g1_i1.p1 TRINITY_DN16477_c0_g1~~TRINITY_DN16477_c0_g1_i1.p1  ORF type:complete len:588 (+),score=212.72 TRINITY_DN16477_c0_g1_i1:33-1766(+)